MEMHVVVLIIVCIYVKNKKRSYEMYVHEYILLAENELVI
jgi:hypothetical protein